ncbi:hypothetical protein [Massilia sp. TSP1-1-2]|uniref:hypothetical protein n=1 Tax=Massilia sp. TSP1-1-2 TaxID=2804649 RepID=UPI003CE743B8
MHPLIMDDVAKPPPNLTYNDVLSAYAAYPAPIRPYLLRAETHPVLRPQFTKSGLRVFIDLLARAPIADPARPISVRADVTADRLALSSKTVGRVLTQLIKTGWLAPFKGSDGRNNDGKFGIRDFVVTEQLRAMVGLPSTPAPRPTVAMAVNEAPQNDQPEPELSPGVIGVNKCIEKEASSKGASKKEDKPKPACIPAGLEELHTQLGISIGGICKLMSIAKACKQRLQDVWVAAGHRLISVGAREGRAYDYFKFLLNTGQDFSYAARCKGGTPAMTATGNAQGAAAGAPAMNTRHYWNRKFRGPNGLVVRIHGDGSGELTDSTRRDAYVSPRDMEQVFAAIAKGQLSEIIE